MRTGSNIRQRQDGRFEARYQKGRDSNGHIVYGYCYGATYDEAEKKRSQICNSRTQIKQMNLLILGAGAHGTEVYELVKSFRIFNRISFLDDKKIEREGILGKCEAFSDYLSEYPVAISAIGDNSIRCKWTNELCNAGFIIPTLVHPTATVSANVKIGEGTVICAGATIGYGAVIGRGCIIDSGAVVERGAHVPDWTLVNCGEVFACK